MTEILELIQKLSQDLASVREHLEHIQKSRLETFKDEWIDGQDVMQSLHISKRTLQTLRDRKKLPYSRIGGKFYYKISDMQQILEANYQPSKTSGYGNK